MDIKNYIVLALLFIIRTLCNNSNSRRLYSHHIPGRRPVINSNTVCGNIAGLSGRQIQLCKHNAHLVASAIQGMQVAVHECKVQFKNHRWNCSALETRNKIPQTSTFLRHENGNKESAFSFAILSAGVVHQVAHACSLGKIKECRCHQADVAHLTASQRKKLRKQINAKAPELKLHTQYFERAGCSDNINFGMDFANKFLDSQDEKDFVSKVRSHNSRVGRLIVANNMRENCRCHGTSGSCSMKTCWRETPDFKAVGLKIKQKYATAVQVSPDAIGNDARGNNVIGYQRETNQNENYGLYDLIYFDESPRYCQSNRRLNVAGTRGRICNHTAAIDEPNSCEELCCSRGYSFHKVKRVEQCRCRFHWCCYVNCEQCEWEETVAVCN